VHQADHAGRIADWTWTSTWCCPTAPSSATFSCRVGTAGRQIPVALFVLPLAQVIDEYTKTELRSLASVPLNPSRREIEDVVERRRNALELRRQLLLPVQQLRGGKLKLLRRHQQSQVGRLDNIMPNGLLEVLKGRGLAIPACSTTLAKPCAWAIASTPSAIVIKPCSKC
jgi:hypothetical protein